MPWTVRDPRLAGSNFWVGAGATGAYFALRDGHRGYWHNGGWKSGHGIHSASGAFIATSAACAAVSPIVGTIVTQRELTQREVFVSTANCFVPILGGWAMNYWFDYYGWDRPKKKALISEILEASSESRPAGPAFSFSGAYFRSVVHMQEPQRP